MYKEVLWKCDCGAEVLGVSFWAPSSVEQRGEWFIEVYKTPGLYTLRWRLRQVFNLVLGRDVVVDAVSLDQEKVRELIAFLQLNISETESDSEEATTEQTK